MKFSVALFVGAFLFLVPLVWTYAPQAEVDQLHAANLGYKKDVGSDPMNLVFVKDAVARNAICNDGSGAGYYLRKGNGSGAKKWVLHLQGGWWCWDSVSCSQRWQGSYTLMSSKWLQEHENIGGILSSDAKSNPDFYNANTVFIPYCTSDTFSGDVSKDQNGQWHFRGRRVLQGVVEDLLNIYGMNAAELILFTGCSAGGQGVVVNADFVGQLVSNTSAQYAAVADAGWLMNMKPYRKNIVSVEDQVKSGIKYWGGIPDESCVAGNPGSEWMCYISPYTAPYITSPIMVQAEQYDAWQLPYNCCNPPLNNTAEKNWAEELRSAFQTSMKILRGPSASAFSAACYAHCLLEGDKFTQIQITQPDGSYSLQQVLGNWIYNRKGPKSLIDECKGFNCSKNCPN